MIQLLYIALYLFYVALFIWLISRWKFFAIEGVSKKHLALFFLLKVTAGVALTLIYTYYYTDQSKADIYRYFRDSKIISSVLFTDPIAWFKIMSGIGMGDKDVFSYMLDTLHFSHPAGDLVTNNALLIKIISILNYFSFYNIYIDTLFLNFITFMGLTALFKMLRIFFADFKALLFIPLFLIPSVIFWTSGLLKESVLFFGISVYLVAWFKGNDSRTLANTLFMLVALLLVSLIKIYVAVLLVLCSLFLPLSNSITGLPYPLARRILLYGFIVFIGWYYFGANFCEKIIYKRDEFILLGLAENAGSSLDTALLEPNCGSFFSVLPQAFVNSIFRPFVWDKGTLFQLFFAIENGMILIASLVGLLFYFKRPTGSKLWLMLFCLSFAFTNYMVIGVTIPVMGAIVHYRTIATPFLFLAVLLMLDTEKLKRYLPNSAGKNNS
ncbi:MAG: hypothetical protein JWO06_119 [Bacteroidota bacterium]|nr:hypothetical protein [Bacteroidota bacterium]